jgi:hypothetical protein
MDGRLVQKACATRKKRKNTSIKSNPLRNNRRNPAVVLKLASG